MPRTPRGHFDRKGHEIKYDYPRLCNLKLWRVHFLVVVLCLISPGFLGNFVIGILVQSECNRKLALDC
jgi:hypothetical protein